ncbi:MAG: hypothetical protein WCD04_14230 [Terriglobia bacterium]
MLINLWALAMSRTAEWCVSRRTAPRYLLAGGGSNPSPVPMHRDTFPDLWGPTDPIGVQESDSPRERASGVAQGPHSGPAAFPAARAFAAPQTGESSFS